MAAFGIVGLRKLYAEVVSNFGYLRTMAPAVIAQPEFVAEIWSEYLPLVSSILATAGTKSKSLNDETKMHVRRLYCRTSKILLEVLYDHITNVRNIYKENPSVLKDVHPDLSSVEVDYADICEFLATADDLMADDVGDDLVDKTRDVLERSKKSEKLLKAYEELIRNAVNVKRKSKTIMARTMWAAILLVVVTVLLFSIPYFVGQPKTWESEHGKQTRNEELATETNGTDAVRQN